MTTSNGYTPIVALEQGKEYSQIFMVTGFQQRKTGKGDPYIQVALTDNSGSIQGCIWKTTAAGLAAGDFISLNIKVGVYKGQKNFTAESYTKFNGKPENLSDYVNVPNPEVINVFDEELDKLLAQVDDPDYRDILNHAKEIGFFERYKEAPSWTTGRMSYAGGLYEHSLKLAKMAIKVYEGLAEDDFSISKSLLITGSLLRNCGWTGCGNFQGNIFEKNGAYFKLGPEHLSLMYANQLIISAESDLNREFPENKKIELLNLTTAYRTNVEHDIITNAEELLNYIHER